MISFLLYTIIMSVFFVLRKISHLEENNQKWIDILLHDKYLHHVVFFSFWQAILSAFLSIILAIMLAQALHRRKFLGRQLLLQIFSINLVIPILVIIIGIVSIYGHNGWLAKICTYFHISYNFSLYGIKGILITHIFLNLPLATRLFLQNLENISEKYCQLSSQLNIYGWNRFQLIEWPFLRNQIIPIFTLIFILCFSTFTIALILGGGPKSTTIEVLIYESLNFNFNPSYAALLSCIQFFICLIFLLINERFKNLQIITSIKYASNFSNYTQDSFVLKLVDMIIIMIAMFFFLPPLFTIVYYGIQENIISILKNHNFLNAVYSSIKISLTSSIFALIFSIMLLWTIRELNVYFSKVKAQILRISGILILTIPSNVLSITFFLLFHNFFDNTKYLINNLFIFNNTLLVMPYIIKILEHPMFIFNKKYNNLCQSLNISGINRFIFVEFRFLKEKIAYALAFSCILSIGDFGILGLFKNDNICTLPIYLYEQMNNYNYKDANVISFFILFFCLLLFYFIENILFKNVKIN
ncbi:thiamine ABC transporter inner membrane subunit [Candidatus Tachikawaea gelatinosa]|uniref:Thiamine transport system permease protein ThiP n=2 Tax=Candidatus Tachikawaea gelatinosa TaxID=1410383 RepID=A0A090BWK1_9ENTR|nr:thiamine ABC transporter inner membrane subunit [Candidatus Tachikawaea gelatinosa]